MLLRYFFCLFILGLTSQAITQGVFKAQANVGMSLAQIQGDRLAGFDKVGWTGGIGVYYPITELFDLGIEISYTEKGSRDNLIFDVPDSIQRTHLQYFEMPIIFQMNEWYIKNGDYYKLSGHIGLNNSYLFQGTSSITNNFLELIPAEEFKNYELAILFGATYRINKKLGVSTRYYRSLTRFYKSINVNTGGLLNYNWTVRIDYSF